MDFSKILKGFQANWKTSLMGIVAFLKIALPEIYYIFDDDVLTVTNWDTIINALMALLIGLNARDWDVSSEGSGAKELEKELGVKNN